ncbi:glycosyltransferase involved in cell wall biosynthesis [Constrictibacter sp. MBR-5]|uniref:glycosyltransferase family 4 protein n=1 Tax=Constrictibacter sp. MBR-5 TaxID=3156467 RepID=UPI003393A27B
MRVCKGGPAGPMQPSAMSSVVASQLGARMHYAVPRFLERSGRLERFYTDICAGDAVADVLRLCPKSLRPLPLRRLIARTPHGVSRDRITTFPGFGLHHALRRLRARTAEDVAEIALWAGARLSARVAARGFGRAGVVFGYNGECLELLRAARSAGLVTVMEQTVAARDLLERLLDQELSAFPNWQVRPATNRFTRATAEREKAEWQSADLILCGSDFVRESIAGSGGPHDRCVVVPYGVDARFAMPARAPHDGPLRVLTVGEVGLRKGSPYVLAAARRLGRRATFRMVGTLGILPAQRNALAEHVELTGPVPRSEMAAHFAWADVMLLPSICEGSATAVYEALAARLPVICTPNTGSVVRDGIEGFIVPIRDPEAIADGIDALAANPQRRRDMGENAGARAAAFTVDAYGARFMAALDAAPAGGRRPAPAETQRS